ncbi:MAG: RNA-binding domain-containing protein [Dorea sp.]
MCSFSNRYGGYIIMGVEDDGTPIGINRNKVSPEIIITEDSNSG